MAWIRVIHHLQGVRRTQRRWSYLAQHLKCYPASLRERLCLVYPTGKEEEAKAAKEAKAAAKEAREAAKAAKAAARRR